MPQGPEFMTETPDDSALDAVLNAYQLRARITDNPQLCGRWREPEDAAPSAYFHLVDQGMCWVESASLDAPVRLGAGDLMLLPRGDAHVLTSEPEPGPDDACFSTLLCGEFGFDGGGRANPLLDALPDCLVVRAIDAGDAYRSLGSLLRAESHRRDFGRQAVMDKLADALFTMAVRHHLRTDPRRRGLLAGLTDPRLRQALDAMHQDPGRNWSVAQLAQIACLSRTAFAQRFSETIGQSPFQYLTVWRMTLALDFLRDPRLSVATVAERLGYQTEAAFRRSFKRIHGSGPGRYRLGGALAA